MFGESFESESEMQFVNFPVTDLGVERAIVVQSASAFAPFQSALGNVEEMQVFDNFCMNDGIVAEPVQCPSKPLRLPTNSFCYCNRSDFVLLRNEIQCILDNIPDYDFSFDQSASLWRGKLIQGVRSLEVVVNCYWDSKLKDHIVSVKKIGGDVLNVSTSDLFDKIQKELATVFSSNSPPTSSHLVGVASQGNFSTARKNRLCVPSCSGSKSSANGEQLLATLSQLQSMTTYSDGRVEAAKMLYDLVASRSSAVFECAELQGLVSSLLQCFLGENSGDEEKQCAVMLLLEFSRSCPKSFSEMFGGDKTVIKSLILLIDNANNEVQSYVTAGMRRCAAETLALMTRGNSSIVRSLLCEEGGYNNKSMWIRHISRIQDQRTRQFASLVSACFDV